MTAFAAVFSWSGSPEPVGQAMDLLAPLEFRQFDSQSKLAVEGADIAIGVRAVATTDDAAGSIFVDKNRQWLAIGDVRLYEPAVVRAQLGEGADCSGVELVARMYAEFGNSGLTTINGDFSVVIWDWRERKVHALRDHFGLRPLFFRVTPDGIALASDIRPLLLLGRGGDECLDPDMILDFLLGEIAHHGLTFFRSIRQVWPGHRLIARPSGVTQYRYWQPSNETRGSLTYPDMIAEWRSRFERAVTCRLESKFPIASYLSGGLDSGSIVGVAHRRYSDEPAGRPPMFTLSALFPGQSGDESILIADAARASPLFDSLTWNGAEVNGTDLLTPHPAMPGLRRGMAYGPCRELELIERHGIRAVLSGLGGDELGWSHGYFRDLVSRGRIVTLVRSLSEMNSWQGGLHHLKMGLRGFGASFLPEGIPLWAGKKLIESFATRTDPRRADDFAFASFSQQENWWLATSPAVSSGTDSTRLVLSDAGAELRLPYRDLRLIEFVFTIPWTLRAPHGDVRRIQRDAINGFLSPMVQKERRKALAGGAISSQLRANFSGMHSVIYGTDWTIRDLVDQEGVRMTLKELEKHDPAIRRPRAWLHVWKIAVLEAWNRARLNYHDRRRTMMHDDNSRLDLEQSSRTAGDGRGTTYESPTLSLVGNTRRLLEANGGPSTDMDGQGLGQNPGP